MVTIQLLLHACYTVFHLQMLTFDIPCGFGEMLTTPTSHRAEIPFKRPMELSSRISSQIDKTATVHISVMLYLDLVGCGDAALDGENASGLR